ncbi:hypothetical protein ACLMJK_006770 [Lecanora helva]
MHFMDKLEQAKSDFKENDAITDNVAGQAYIEQFALETFQRAENAMKANKASRQTADTFQAAVAFLDLGQIWGPLEPDIASKIKFAKYHSLRILKAIKAGEDPNLSNPAIEIDEGPPLDPNDPEVQMLNGPSLPGQNPEQSRQPTVVEVPDEHGRLQESSAQRSVYNESLHPSRAPSIPPPPAQSHSNAPQPSGEEYYQENVEFPQVSPIAPQDTEVAGLDGGGYFPRVPDNSNDSRNTASLDTVSTGPELNLPDPSSLPPPGASGFHTSRPPPTDPLHSFPPPNVEDTAFSSPASASFPNHLSAPPAAPPPTHYSHSSAAHRDMPETSINPTSSAPKRQEAPTHDLTPPLVSSKTGYAADEESILKAQKHARWAISALNFEDVNTAVKELRGALESLNAK